VYYSTEFSLLSTLQLVFDETHFVLDQVDRQCLNIRDFARFDVHDFHQRSQVVFARLQGVSPVRAAQYWSDHDLCPNGVLNSPRERAASGSSGQQILCADGAGCGD